MATKIIYFVRHGQTENNANNIRQDSKGPLSELGRTQALTTAKRFPKEKGRPEVIIASPYERAMETAEIIAKELNMTVIYSDLLVERRNPKAIVGHSGNDPEVRKIVDLIDKSFHNDNLRYGDEENFVDLKDRARQVLECIKNRSEDRIVIVTHMIFLKMIVCYMLKGDSLTASEYNNLSYLNPIANAGMTICSYTTHLFKKEEWKLLVWNDLEVV